MGDRASVPDNPNVKPHIEAAHPAHLGGLGKGDHSHIQALNKNANGGEPLLHNASVGADGSITIHPAKGEKRLAQGMEHPLYMEPNLKAPEAPKFKGSSLELAESVLKTHPPTDVKDKDGKVVGKQFEDPHSHSKFTEMNDGTKRWETGDAHGSTTIEKRADGSWSETEINKDTGKKTTSTGKSDGSGTETEETSAAKATARWGPGGTFEESTEMNKKTGRGTITKPDKDGRLQQEPLIQT